MKIHWCGVLPSLFPILVLASAGGPVSPFPWSGVPRAQSVAAGNDGLATDELDTSSGSVAIIPFMNISGNVADDWIGDGIAETVMADLESLGNLTVIPQERVRSVAAHHGEPDLNLDEAAIMTLGRELGARWLVTGGYQRLGRQLRITGRLIDAQSGLVARTMKADGTLDELFDLQDRIAAELTAQVRPNATAQATSRGSGRRAAPAAARGGRDRPAVAGRPGAEDASSPGGLGSGTVTGGIILPDTDPPVRSGPEGRGGQRGRSGAGAPADGGSGTAASAGILAGRPNVTVVRADEGPRIDGRLDDAIWRRATHITEFVQQSPIEGAPATEDTDIYIAYDNSHLYVGMHAHYSDPGMVRASRVDRDQARFGDDTISIYFDTFLDQQRAYVFSLNGYGVQGDSLMGSRGGGGGGGGGRRGGGRRRSGRRVSWGRRGWRRPGRLRRAAGRLVLGRAVRIGRRARGRWVDRRNGDSV